MVYDTLPTASAWLKRNNPIFRQYVNIPSINSSSPSDLSPVLLPLAYQRYKRLMAGFIKLDNLTLPISYGDLDLE
ncbi:10301_t:CDS:2, partial [Racocetra persica]